ncbi:hypothetical protein HMPREF0653_00520 [Prevotella disiens JCM 6334 = ATCC 29426]|uniref:Uncharacterized protein n=1 Tax=Prevotella disiens JCM 6334 = ATCC 29426 TaxID=1235811 RepID=A0ABP2Y9R3_9BACT|nr:hypothetical protein HMPREF0653_00520 [Prevotella disiens JCM 6334 = ATCC 29426]
MFHISKKHFENLLLIKNIYNIAVGNEKYRKALTTIGRSL